MSKVITFSRSFPSYHPKKGQDTFFVEQVWNGTGGVKEEYRKYFEDYDDYRKSILWGYRTYGSKYHTVRSGNRWKVGDMASLRVWGNDVNPKSGRSGPYHSKQIIIAPDVEIKKVWPVIIVNHGNFIFVEIDRGDGTSIQNDCVSYKNKHNSDKLVVELSKNDGLSYLDFKNWFPKKKNQSCTRYDCQIICWSDHIKY